MADTGIFRVKIDLGQFYSDHKAKAYVSVNRQWKNVRQFHRHITEIFDVKKFVLLTNDGVYLPAKENIGIIESGDMIHVIPKHDDNESVVSVASETVRTLTKQNINEHLRTNEEGAFKVLHSVSPSIEIISSKKSNILGAGDEEYVESVATNDTSGSAGSKRKRVRHRKKKNVPENDENQMNLPNVETATGGILKHDALTKGPFSEQSTAKSNTHVRFEDEQSLSELDEEVTLPKKARVIHANVIGIRQMNGNSVEREEVTKMENDQNSDIVESSEPLAFKTSNDDVPEGDAPKSETTESALEILAKNVDEIGKYKDMNNDAKEMEMIAFKVFTPSFEKSDYVIGLVESIIGKSTPDQKDYDLVLQIMGGSKHIEHLKDPTVDENEDIRIQINRMDIFDAKIVTL